jgi:hypothetical protein
MRKDCPTAMLRSPGAGIVVPPPAGETATVSNAVFSALPPVQSVKIAILVMNSTEAVAILVKDAPRVLIPHLL